MNILRYHQVADSKDEAREYWKDLHDHTSY